MAAAGIANKVVLITGASGNIGSSAAEAFARAGAKLALTGRNSDKLSNTSKRCQAAGASASDIFTVTGDITNSDDVTNIVNKTVDKFGGIDILVNSAGIVKPGVFLTAKMDDFDELFNTNLFGIYSVCKAASPHIIARKGCIINVSSYTGIRPVYAYFVYGMVEAALDQFTKALALEMGPKGVRVNSVNPGAVKGGDFWTRPGAPMEKSKDNLEQIQEGMKKMYPLRRLTEATDVADAILFLASDSASFIHGVILPVDGGKVLTSKACLDDKAQF
ncbi:hypothetical protein CAPTEDRAFT_148116 [Capitella teleta]|uniref:Ketoreductase domain-containing protein n=1 Tax=Capitella teleta TaxID=283909 RepID=R7TZC1_CAPTE|nr:hypothetical protein CAPTEDRAFT_148116 [Capitella teleta]|eukprot:ELT96275.1 hypothetical protein CAPTEDRAFT_148116 [Capitella teleta]